MKNVYPPFFTDLIFRFLGIHCNHQKCARERLPTYGCPAHLRHLFTLRSAFLWRHHDIMIPLLPFDKMQMRLSACLFPKTLMGQQTMNNPMC